MRQAEFHILRTEILYVHLNFWRTSTAALIREGLVILGAGSQELDAIQELSKVGMVRHGHISLKLRSSGPVYHI